MTFDIDDAVVNLVDTPGRPNFIAEVERLMEVVVVVLMVSVAGGVRARTQMPGVKGDACANG